MRGCILIAFFAYCVLLPPAVFAGNAGSNVVSESKVDELVSKARMGRNREVIALYEALPENVELPLVAMRAVAGCYWRERRFDESRVIYQHILDRRPTLQHLSKQPDSKRPLLSEGEQIEVEVQARIEQAEAKAREAEARAQDVASQVEKAVAAEQQRTRGQTEQVLQEKKKLAKELEALRKASADLEQQHEQMRKATRDKIDSLVKAAEVASSEMQSIRLRLSEEQDRRRAAEEVAEQIQRGFEHDRVTLEQRITELASTLASARGELKSLRKSNKEQSELQNEEPKDVERKPDREPSDTGKREHELKQKISMLDAQVKAAQAALKDSRSKAAEQLKAAQEREAVLADRVNELESLAASANDEVAELAQALERSRLRNAEISAAQSSIENKTAKIMEATEDSALASALKEIDALERDYAELDRRARERQQALLDRIDAMEQSSVTSKSELANVRQQLELERKLREAMEHHGEKRDEAMLEANRVLANATLKMAEQFDAMRGMMSESPKLRLGDDSKKPADLAPLIGKLEDATESASIEAKELRETLARERKQHADERKASEKEIASLRRRVDTLMQEVVTLKASNAKREAELKTEMQKAVAEAKAEGKARETELLAEMEARIKELKEAGAKRERELLAKDGDREASIRAEAKQEIDALKAAHSERVTELQKEISRLGSEIDSSVAALARAEKELAGQRDAYRRLVVDSGEVEEALRKRIRDLELAFNLPASPEAAARTDEVGDRKIEKRVAALYQSITDTAKSDRSLAIAQFEALPKESAKPMELLKTIANLYRERHDYDDAYKIYEEILKRSPGDLYAERKLVMTLFDLGRYDEALERLTGAQKSVE